MISTTAVSVFAAGLELFRTQVDPNIPSPVLATFLQIAMKPGLSVQEIAESLNMPQSSTSKNVFILSKHQTPTLPGYDLVKSEIDEFNRRRRKITLTPKGERLIETLRRIIT